jgi:tetratricopeptide (TPR) repeat protein
MDYDGAIESFERALQANPANAAAHLELGLLYEERKNDYVAAIYHYQRHLTYRTNSTLAEMVKSRIAACTREVARNVSFAVLTKEVQSELERMARTNSMLREKVENLQSELARRPQYITNYVTNFVTVPTFEQRSASRIITAPTVPAPSPEPRERADREEEPAPAPRSNPREPEARKQASRHSGSPATTRPNRAEPAVRTQPAASAQIRTSHTVRPGETLASLAAKYGVPLKELKAANPSAAGGVRAGQKINIPAK